MKLHYYPETDSLYIELKSAPGAETREIVEGLVVDLDANGEVVGFDIDHASRKLDLSKVETIALPSASGGVTSGAVILSPSLPGLTRQSILFK
jgi:uncharacterized protein YuzE